METFFSVPHRSPDSSAAFADGIGPTFAYGLNADHPTQLIRFSSSFRSLDRVT
jgi:hypothetical protein